MLTSPRYRLLRPALVLAAVLAVGLGTTANADTIFTNFGPGQSFNSLSGTLVGFYATDNFVPAASFTPGSDYVLTQLDLALGIRNPSDGAFTVSLVNSASNLPGTTVLGSWSVSGLPAYGGVYAPTTITPGATINLTANTQYWLEVSASASPILGEWNANNQGGSGYVLSEDGGATFSSNAGDTPAFDVLGRPAQISSVTPEPSTWILLATGLLALGFAIRRRRFAADAA